MATTPPPAPDARAERRRLLALAWPVMLTGLNWTLLQVTDVAVVGLTGTDEVAALGASRALTYVVGVAGFAWLSGVLVAVARADGAGERARTGAHLREGLLLAAVLGLAAALVLALAPVALLHWIGVAPGLVAPAARVVRVMALAYPFQMLSIAASFFLEGVGRPGRVAAVNLAVLPVNALLAWGWSGGHLGLPALGAEGAAAATACASGLAAVAMLAAARTLPGAGERNVRYLGLAEWRAAPAGAWALARFGAVPAIASGLELAGFAVLIALSTDLGDTTAHAFQIVFSVHNVTFALSLGLGSAAGVRAGNAVGEGRGHEAGARVRLALGMAAGAMASAALVLAVGARAIAALFPASAPVHALAAAMLPAWAPFIPFDGLQLVLVYALRSLGDQVAAGVNSILAYFVVTGGLGWWLVSAGVGPFALVWASGAGMIAAAALHGARFAVVSARLRPRS